MKTRQFITDEAKESLRLLLKKIQNKSDFQRAQCVWLRAELGFDANLTAKITGWSPGTVKRIWSNYLKKGEAALYGVGRGGRRRNNLTYQEEKIFLEDFFKKTALGESIPVADIKLAYETKINKIVPKSTIYRILTRHGWKK